MHFHYTAIIKSVSLSVMMEFHAVKRATTRKTNMSNFKVDDDHMQAKLIETSEWENYAILSPKNDIKKCP